MKVNDIVTIYYDPYTQKLIEDKAKLIECVVENDGYFEGRKVQIWKVQFLSKLKEIHARKILVDEVVQN